MCVCCPPVKPFLFFGVVEWVAERSGKEYNGGVLRIVCDVYA